VLRLHVACGCEFPCPDECVRKRKTPRKHSEYTDEYEDVFHASLKLAASGVLFQLADAVAKAHESDGERDQASEKKRKDRADIRHCCGKQVSG